MVRNNYYFVWCWTLDYEQSRTLIIKSTSRVLVERVALKYLKDKYKSDWKVHSATIISKKDTINSIHGKPLKDINELPQYKRSRLSKCIEESMRAILKVIDKV